MKQIMEGEKKWRVGTWFYPLVIDWMQADLNANLQSIILKLIVESGICHQREMSSLKMMMLHMQGWIVRITINNMHLGKKGGGMNNSFSFHAVLNS